MISRRLVAPLTLLLKNGRMSRVKLGAADTRLQLVAANTHATLPDFRIAALDLNLE